MKVISQGSLRVYLSRLTSSSSVIRRVCSLQLAKQLFKVFLHLNLVMNGMSMLDSRTTTLNTLARLLKSKALLLRSSLFVTRFSMKVRISWIICSRMVRSTASNGPSGTYSRYLLGSSTTITVPCYLCDDLRRFFRPPREGMLIVVRSTSGLNLTEYLSASWLRQSHTCRLLRVTNSSPLRNWHS